MSALLEWESFYVIVGSSAAALTGLQFVVITLVADLERDSSGREIAAFGTPTVVHFCTALLASAVLSAPWPHLSGAGWTLAVTGILGLLYDAIVIRRAVHQSGYRPVLEDWVWHNVLPILAHVALLLAALRLAGSPTPSLFVIAGAVLLLLFIGIHNAWDTVTYIAIELRKPGRGRLQADVAREALPSEIEPAPAEVGAVAQAAPRPRS